MSIGLCSLSSALELALAVQAAWSHCRGCRRVLYHPGNREAEPDCRSWVSAELHNDRTRAGAGHTLSRWLLAGTCSMTGNPSQPVQWHGLDDGQPDQATSFCEMCGCLATRRRDHRNLMRASLQVCGLSAGGSEQEGAVWAAEAGAGEVVAQPAVPGPLQHAGHCGNHPAGAAGIPQPTPWRLDTGVAAVNLGSCLGRSHWPQSTD